jgi:hypothetical protein
MIGKATLMLAGAIVACASASAAQFVPRDPLVTEFGACAARQLPSQARALMLTPVDSRAERQAARRLATSRSACVDRRLRSLTMHTGELRGAVAEALLEQDANAMARLAAMPPSAPVRAPAADGRAFVMSYARCIADAEPARAARLLEVAPATAEHRAAFLAFGQVLSDCMPHGLRYTIDQFDVRNHIAVRLYDMAFPR